jgi:hypothetical protein
VKLGLASRDELRGTYPDVESARATVGLLEAAAVVAERNHASLEAGEGTPFTARFSPAGIELIGPDGRQPIFRGLPY